MAENGPIGQQELLNRVYKGPNKSGDNIDLLVTAGYIWNGSQWQRPATPLIDVSYDAIARSNPDSNGNYQTMVFSNGGTTVRTLTFTYDASSNVTGIARS